MWVVLHLMIHIIDKWIMDRFVYRFRNNKLELIKSFYIKNIFISF